VDQLTCTNCKTSSQSDAGIPVCPACGQPNPDHRVAVTAVATVETAEHPLAAKVAEAALTIEPVTVAPTPSPAPVAIPVSAPVQTAAAPSAPAAAPAAPAAPAESMLQKVENAAEKILALVAAESPIVASMFATGPVGAILKLLGPTAAIGAAVLHQHLTTQGFDLSQLETIDQVK
jgi:hypothetical protein